MSIYVNPDTWLLKTAGGIPYCRKEGFPKGKVGQDLSLTEEVIVRESDLAAFVTEANPTISFTGGSFTITPGRCCPGFANTTVAEIEFSPFEPGKVWMVERTDPEYTNWTPTADNKYCHFLNLVISYKSLTGGDGSGQTVEDYLELSAEAGGEFLQMSSATGAKFVSSIAHYNPAGETVGVNAQETPYDMSTLPSAKFVPTTEWTATFPKFPYSQLPNLMTNYRQKLGTVNSTYMPLLGNAPPGTILFTSLSARATFQYGSNGWTQMATVSLKFSEKCITAYMDQSLHLGEYKGHNYFFRPETRTFDLLLINGDEVYGSSNLSSLYS